MQNGKQQRLELDDIQVFCHAEGKSFICNHVYGIHNAGRVHELLFVPQGDLSSHISIMANSEDLLALAYTLIELSQGKKLSQEKKMAVRAQDTLKVDP